MSITRLCPADTLSQSSCEQLPNAAWVNGQCFCCLLNGTEYASSSGCSKCDPDEGCGSRNGFCKGNPLDLCTQDPTTMKWSQDCDGTCTGQCTGGCGISEYFLFRKCKRVDGSNSCSLDITQWKSWGVWVGIVLLLVVLVGLITKKKDSSGSSSPK